MKIKKVKTILFEKELSTRGSFPSAFLCDDNFKYIVKHSQQGRNYRHLINELIAALLGNKVGIPIPDFALVKIDVNILTDNYIFKRGKPIGLGFGSKFIESKYIPDISTIIELLNKKKNIEFAKDLVKICIFDIWLKNTDRSVNNPNLILAEKKGKLNKIYAIDHSSIFFELDYLNLEKEIQSQPSIGEYLIDFELFNRILDLLGFNFNFTVDEFCRKIEELSLELIQEILNNIPNEWPVTSKEKMCIEKFIFERKSLVKSEFFYLLESVGVKP